MSEENNQVYERSLQFVRSILKVLYSPMNAFKGIAKKPNIKGPILILTLVLLLSLGLDCIQTSKIFLETQTPEKDIWTEASQSLQWNSNGDLIYNATDYLIGNYCISSSVNESTILMELMELDNINCSENSRLSFCIKFSDEVPSLANLNLYSEDSNVTGFELDISHLLVNETNIWMNITLNLLSENWNETPSANWANITGIGFQFAWLDFGNYVIKIDGLFFGKFESQYSIYGVDVILFLSLFNNAVSFLLEWLILSVLILLILRSFYTWNGTFKYLMSYVGYVYAAFLIFLGIATIISIPFPSLYIPSNIYSQEYINVMQIYQTNWVTPGLLVQLVYYGWVTMLLAISIKELVELSWSKAILVSFGAFIMSVLFSSFLLSALF
jgi:hypothetical protein